MAVLYIILESTGHSTAVSYYCVSYAMLVSTEVCMQQVTHNQWVTEIIYIIMFHRFILISFRDFCRWQKMSGSQSFGSGQRFYHNLCPVTLEQGDLVPCARCFMVRYRSETATNCTDFLAAISSSRCGNLSTDRCIITIVYRYFLFLLGKVSNMLHPKIATYMRCNPPLKM